MASSSKIKVMISSRCKDGFPVSTRKGGQSLTDIRRELKKEIEAQKLFGTAVFEVWINEDAPPAPGTLDSWDKCLAQVKDCDILLVLANGSAGWAKDADGVGVCHAEYMYGLNSAPGKVWVVALPETEPAKPDEVQRNERFAEYLNQQSAFRGDTVKTIDELKVRVRQALSDAVVTLTQRGVKSSGSSRFDMGQALDWSRLDFRERTQRMQEALMDSLVSRGTRLGANLISAPVAKTKVAFAIHAIPAAMGIAAAREAMGRPFLRDHERVSELGGSAGPVHLIACHRTATESQAIALLGFPDATVVSGSFGIYVADDVQKVQFVFLKNCRDESNLRHAQQRFFEWLEQTGEADLLAKRATSRLRIVKAIANELKR